MSPLSILASGLGFVILGGVLIGFGIGQDFEALAIVGYVVAALASIPLLVGIIATGVDVGMRSSHQ